MHQKKKNPKNKPEINCTKEHKHLYSHGLQDKESGFKSYLPTDLQSDSGQITQWTEAEHINRKMDTNPVCLPRAVKLQENTYLGPGGWSVSGSLSLYEIRLEMGSPDPVSEGQV